MANSLFFTLVHIQRHTHAHAHATHTQTLLVGPVGNWEKKIAFILSLPSFKVVVVVEGVWKRSGL